MKAGSSERSCLASGAALQGRLRLRRLEVDLFAAAYGLRILLPFHASCVNQTKHFLRQGRASRRHSVHAVHMQPAWPISETPPVVQSAYRSESTKCRLRGQILPSALLCHSRPFWTACPLFSPKPPCYPPTCGAEIYWRAAGSRLLIRRSRLAGRLAAYAAGCSALAELTITLLCQPSAMVLTQCSTHVHARNRRRST